jgi:hypothetical protein
MDRNGLNTAMGEAILQSFYPDLFQKMLTPIEERSIFTNITQQYGTLEKVAPELLNPPLITCPGITYYKLKTSLDTQPAYAFVDRQPPHRFIPQTTDPSDTTVHALIRHPVQRFLSYVYRYTPEFYYSAINFDKWQHIDTLTTKLENWSKEKDFQFSTANIRPQAQILEKSYKNIKFYKYPDHIYELTTDLELAVPPTKEPSLIKNHITLTAKQETIIQNFYKEDLELYSNITQPGIIFS